MRIDYRYIRALNFKKCWSNTFKFGALSISGFRSIFTKLIVVVPLFYSQLLALFPLLIKPFRTRIGPKYGPGSILSFISFGLGFGCYFAAFKGVGR